MRIIRKATDVIMILLIISFALNCIAENIGIASFNLIVFGLLLIVRKEKGC